MKKILVTSTDLMMIQFLIPHVMYLSESGYQVEIACSDVGGKIDEINKSLDGKINMHIIELARNPLKMENAKGYNQLKYLINTHRYDLIWTNEPVMGVMTRFAAKQARKIGAKVIYMVHGFHFYKGGPIKNWLIFFPIEKLMSKYCDAIITINKEDFVLSNKNFKHNSTYYIHGIGFDFNKYESTIIDKKKKLAELGLPLNRFIVMSAGELNSNKNHEVIIRGIAKLNDKSIIYVICGKGTLNDYLVKLSKELLVDKQVYFTGYRIDLNEIYKIADIFAFPSKREGLGLAALQAMAAGLPIITSNRHGIADYSINNVTGFNYDPDDLDGFADGIKKLKNAEKTRFGIGKKNINIAEEYGIDIVKTELSNILKKF